jgi:hypothetical protein
MIGRQTETEPITGAAGNHMKMCVRHLLACRFTVSTKEGHPVALRQRAFHRKCDAACRLPDGGSIGVGEPPK